MVPDSCRATKRNSNSISADDIIENELELCLVQLFSDNLAGVLDFLILEDKHNICTLSIKIK